jgi:gamma-glutamyl phosphate reductase
MLKTCAAREGGDDAAFVDRLTPKPETIEAMAKGPRTSVLADPVGEISGALPAPNQVG